MAMSPSSTVHGGQHDTKYVAFESLMHAAFVADEIWRFMPEPARISIIVGGSIFVVLFFFWCAVVFTSFFVWRRVVSQLSTSRRT